ncbi:hypothetical protein T190115A13A_20041 [Tenacibaculum sp. 190524A02b]|uniref:Uncharacterized protein n=1 Tax=Tenacibaculum vairaonense TaxID=3137860 RepID=A0ABP1FD07_9FLAO
MLYIRKKLILKNENISFDNSFDLNFLCWYKQEIEFSCRNGRY